MKFYVECGSLMVTIDRESSYLAAVDAIDNFGHKHELTEDVVVSERGFSDTTFTVYNKYDILVDISNETD